LNPAFAAASNRSRKPISWNMKLRLAANFGIAGAPLFTGGAADGHSRPWARSTQDRPAGEGVLSVLLGAIEELEETARLYLLLRGIKTRF
jgi:hypothetical protein